MLMQLQKCLIWHIGMFLDPSTSANGSVSTKVHVSENKEDRYYDDVYFDSDEETDERIGERDV